MWWLMTSHVKSVIMSIVLLVRNFQHFSLSYFMIQRFKERDATLLFLTFWFNLSPVSLSRRPISFSTFASSGHKNTQMVDQLPNTTKPQGQNDCKLREQAKALYQIRDVDDTDEGMSWSGGIEPVEEFTTRYEGVLSTRWGNQDSPPGESSSHSGGVKGISSVMFVSLLATSCSSSPSCTSSERTARIKKKNSYENNLNKGNACKQLQTTCWSRLLGWTFPHSWTETFKIMLPD